MKFHPSIRSTRRRRQAAATLAVTMLVVLAIATFLGIAATITSQFGRYAGRQQATGMEAAYCDAALEYAYAQWKTQMNNLTATNPTIPMAASISLNATDFVTNAFPYATQLSIDTSDWFGPTPTNSNLSGNSSYTPKYNYNCFTIYAVDQNGLNSGLVSYTAGSPATIATDPLTAPAALTTKNVYGYPGWQGTSYNYKAVVKVRSKHYGMDNSETYQAVRYFQATVLPLCQGLAFYEGNMEIHPGATMVLNGPIHSNGKIWAQGFAPVQFKANISDTGGYYDGSSNPAVKYGWDGKNTSATNPDPYKPYFPVLYADGLPAAAAPNAYYGALAQSAVAASQVNTVSPINPFGPNASTGNNGLRSIITVPTDPTNTSPQIAYNVAQLVITVNSNSLTTVAGVTTNLINAAAITIQVRDPLTGILAPAVGADYTNILGAINNGMTTPITDKRESTTAYVTNLDMTKLDAATTAPTTGTGAVDTTKATALQKAFNTTAVTVNGVTTPVQSGTVYIHDISGRTGATRGAVRLINGANLGENVSVASENGVYIQGDFNTGVGTVPSDQPGAATTAAPQVAGYSRYTASVMADAVTILSNGWKDSNSGLTIGSRVATPTTVNTAILSGDVASNTNGNGIASGGMHNFPRFLENWSNINFTYYGSLIQAFNSAQYTGVWQTNDVYTWPNRLWNYDTNFTTSQPPGLPQSLLLSRGRWERNYLPTRS